MPAVERPGDFVEERSWYQSGWVSVRVDDVAPDIWEAMLYRRTVWPDGWVSEWCRKPGLESWAVWE